MYVPDSELVNNFVTIDGEPVLCPSVLQWGLKAISDNKAGRDEGADVTMHPMKIALKRTYHIEWHGPGPAETAKILRLVNTGNSAEVDTGGSPAIRQTFEATLYDPMDMAYKTRTFYVGDQDAQFAIWIQDNPDMQTYSQVSFDLIEV